MTLGSGQLFHWEKLGNGFIGAIGDRPVYVEQHGDSLLTSCQDEKLIRNYFALDHPLAEICASFPVDPVMGAAKEFCRGLRIVRQPKWECLATFICSSMKQVAHIRQISRSLREQFGEQRKIDPPSPRLRRGDTVVVHTFPTVERIAESSEKELRKCGLGYRAKNLLASAHLVASGDVDLEKLVALTDLDLRARLCELPGVGSKVANCVMLFAYERLRVPDRRLGRASFARKVFSAGAKIERRPAPGVHRGILWRPWRLRTAIFVSSCEENRQTKPHNRLDSVETASFVTIPRVR